MNEGYVYLVTDGHYYKIGLTRNEPYKRLAQLQTGTAHRLSMVDYGLYENCADMEKYLHQKYSNKRVSGEWFNLSEDEVKAIRKEFDTEDGESSKITNFIVLLLIESVLLFLMYSLAVYGKNMPEFALILSIIILPILALKPNYVLNFLVSIYKAFSYISRQIRHKLKS